MVDLKSNQWYWNVRKHTIVYIDRVDDTFTYVIGYKKTANGVEVSSREALPTKDVIWWIAGGLYKRYNYQNQNQLAKDLSN